MRWVRCQPLGVLLIIGLAVLLVGCGSGRLREEREAIVNIYPDHYRADLLAALHTYMSDPTHIRDAYVSEPAINPIGVAITIASTVAKKPACIDAREPRARAVEIPLKIAGLTCGSTQRKWSDARPLRDHAIV